MRTLRNSELGGVAGGQDVVIMNGYSTELLHMMHEDALSEAWMDGVVVGCLATSTLLYAAVLPISTSLTAGVAVGALVYNYSYQNSENWTWKL